MSNEVTSHNKRKKEASPSSSSSSGFLHSLPEAVTMSNYAPDNKRRKKEASPSSSSSSLSGFLHSLPEAVTISCLARVSRLDHAALSLVSKSYRSMVVSSDLYQTRSLMGYAEKFIYVCLTIPPDSTPSWFILRPTLDVATGNTVNRANPIPSSPSQPREGFSVVALDWGIYVIGGWVNGKRTSGVLVLDCRSHKWYHVTSMRVARVSAEARVVDGKIYVMGGCKEKRDSDWGEVFDPKTQTWAYLPISKPMVESTSPIMSLIHGNVIRRCYYLPSQSKWKTKKQTNRTKKLWPHDRKPTYCKDWCVTNKLIYTCGNDGGIYWCEAKDLVQCETVGTIGWKKVLGRTLCLPILEEGLFDSRAVYFGGKMIKMWESYKIMYNISKNLDELLPAGTNLTNNGQNIIVFWEKNADVRGNKRLCIWCAEISLERQSCGEVWGDCKGIESVLVVDLVTVDPFLYNSKVLCSIPVDV